MPPRSPSPFALLVVGCLVAASARAAGGTLVERVTVADAPELAYAVYLPSAYDASRPYPLLVLLDARKGALVPIEAFRAAADRFGWVLASSYDSFSDGDPWPTVAAARAVRRDVAARYAIDPGRVAIGGFSGTARIASWLARTEPQPYLAVVAAGAGFAETVQPAADLPFGWFATVGERDFNYREVLDVERELRRLGAAAGVAVFAGGHRWPPPETATVAMAWLELLAMRRGVRPRDEALLGELWGRHLERGAAAAAANDWLGAERAYRSAVADFATLRDTAPAAAALERVVARREHRAARREAEALAERELELVRAAQRALVGLAPARTTPARLAERMGVDRLRKLARSAEPAEAAMADRVLGAIRGQLGFYLPTAAEARGDRALAELLRATAALLAEPSDGHRRPG